MKLPSHVRVLSTLAVTTCLVVAGLAGAQAGAAAVKSCPDMNSPDKVHGGYFTNFKVTNVTCRSARKLALAYYKCRRAKGIKGSCSGRTINSLKCKEFRPESGDNGVEFNATVTCKRGSKKVVHSYQQPY